MRERSAYSSKKISHGNVVKTAKGRKFVGKPDEDMKPRKMVYFQGKRYFIDGRIAG